MHPPRFNGVEPGTLAGQWTDDQATAACTFDTLIVGVEPLSHHCAAVPGRMVPDEQQGLLPVLGQACGNPGQIVTGDLADGPPSDKAQPHSIRRRQDETVAGEGLAVGVS